MIYFVNYLENVMFVVLSEIVLIIYLEVMCSNDQLLLHYHCEMCGRVMSVSGE